MARNQTIFYEGDKAEAMFFIEVGSVRLYRKLEGMGGAESTMAVLKAGDFFGEEAILGEPTRYPYFAQALEPGILHVLTRQNLEQIMLQSMSAGTRILLEVSRHFRESLEDPEILGSLILFYSPRDGGGRTTLSVNLAILLARLTGKPVAYLDADFQLGNAAMIAGSSPVPNIGGLVQTEPDLVMDRIRWYLHQHHGVDFLWGPEMPQDSELISQDALRRIVREMRRQYPFVVVESKSYIDEQTLFLWDEADRFCLVGTPDLGFLERTLRLKRLWQSLGYDDERFFGIMSKTSTETQGFCEEFGKVLQRPVFTLRAIPDLARRAELDGQPVAIAAPDSEYMEDLETLANALLGKDATTPGTARKTGGILSRLRQIFG